MRLYRNAIILAVILALLAGAYVVLKNKKGPDGDNAGQQDTSTIKVLELKKDKITEITVDNDMGRYVFVKKDDKWVATSPADFKTNSSRVESIAFEMASFNADKLVEENASDLAKYGLDKPVVVSVKLDGGDVKTVDIGSQTLSKSGYYVKTADNNKVYVIGTYKAETLLAKYSDIRDKVILSLKPEDISGFTLERSGSVVFKTVEAADKKSWSLTEPISANADVARLSEMFGPIAGLTASEFIEPNAADLDKYGLKNPAYGLEVVSPSGTTKILLGDEKVKGTEIYARLADSNEVFTLNESSVNFIDKPLKEIMEVFAYIVNIQDVDKIVVNIDGQTQISDIKTDPGGDTDKDKFFVNGRDATVKDESDSQLFRKYYQALIGITMSDLEIGAKPTGTPDITFTYYLKKEPKEVKVEFIPKNDSFYYVVKNGVYSNIIVAKSKFDGPEGLRETYKKLIEAMDKANK